MKLWCVELISKERPHDAMFIAPANPANVLALVEALGAAAVADYAIRLHADTQKLVTDFCTALAEKLQGPLKYGYDTD
ncbi:hypothetical protein J4734_02785 [Klebsiella pneumoniae]|uniref:Uncharacterized protein n=1 Tax=Klebsiella pneumoniae TaxID=573 RepID=A0A939NT41_KLEPN|nr:hypothetical protein [Klebsiella pneumoniae]